MAATGARAAKLLDAHAGRRQAARARDASARLPHRAVVAVDVHRARHGGCTSCSSSSSASTTPCCRSRPAFRWPTFPNARWRCSATAPTRRACSAPSTRSRTPIARRRARVRAGAVRRPTRRSRARRSAASPARRSCSPTRRTIRAPAATATPRACSPRCSRRDPRDAVLGLLIDRASAKQAHEVGARPHARSSGSARRPACRATCRSPASSRSWRSPTASSPAPARCSRASGWSWGRWRCCSSGNVRVVLASKKVQAADQEMFRHVGIEPVQQRILALKSSVHFRADFQPIAREVLVVVAPGPAKADPDDVPLDAPAPRAAPEAARAGVRTGLNATMAAASSSASSSTRPTRSRRSPTPLSSFGHGEGPAFGEAARARFEHTNTPMAAYLDLARARARRDRDAGRRRVVAVEQGVARDVRDAGAPARGRGARRLRRRVPRPARRDGDRGLRRRRRRDRAAAAPHRARQCRSRSRSTTTPTCRGTLVDNATVITGYKTYPHVDMYEAGMLAGGILVGALDGAVEPVMAWGWKPLLASVMRHAPEDGPSGDILALRAAHGGRRHGARGDAAAVVPARGHAVHRRLRHRGRRRAPRRPRARAGRVQRTCSRWRGTGATSTCSTRRRSPSRSRARRRSASRNPGAPVLLIDHCDNCGSGGAQDVMAVVAEILKQELDDVAIAPIRDPAAVATMIDAGVGQRVQARARRPHRHAVDRPRRRAARGRRPRARDHRRRVRRSPGPMYTGVTHVPRPHGACVDTRRARRSSSPSARTSRSTSACSRTRASIRARSAT